MYSIYMRIQDFARRGVWGQKRGNVRSGTCKKVYTLIYIYSFINGPLSYTKPYKLVFASHFIWSHICTFILRCTWFSTLYHSKTSYQLNKHFISNFRINICFLECFLKCLIFDLWVSMSLWYLSYNFYNI